MLYDVLIVDGIPDVGRPMFGTPLRVTVDELAGWLSRFVVTKPIVGLAKDEIEAIKKERVAWVGGLFEGNRKKKSLGTGYGFLTYDCDHNSVTDLAAALVGWTAIVHSTFKHTPSAPRCRAILPLAETVDVSTKERAWLVFGALLASCGIVLDESCKDAARLNFGAIVPEGVAYEFHYQQGDLLDAHRMLAAHPPKPRPEPKPLPKAEHRDRYVAGALDRAAVAVQSASDGVRHHTLCREAFCLARPELGLSDAQIAGALVPAFVQAAGEGRRAEAERTIRDQVRARRAA